MLETVRKQGLKPSTSGTPNNPTLAIDLPSSRLNLPTSASASWTYFSMVSGKYDSSIAHLRLPSPHTYGHLTTGLLYAPGISQRNTAKLFGRMTADTGIMCQGSEPWYSRTCLGGEGVTVLRSAVAARVILATGQYHNNLQPCNLRSATFIAKRSQASVRC